MKKKNPQKKFKNLPKSKNSKNPKIEVKNEDSKKVETMATKPNKDKINKQNLFSDKKTIAKIKNQENKTQFLFPNNKRFITEVKSASFWAFLTSLIGIIVAIFIGFYLFKKTSANQKRQHVLKMQFSQTQAQITKYPDIKYLYLKAAILAFELKNFTQAKILLQKAIKLDPNDQQTLRVKAEMNL